jgi:hypothetical protein
MSGGRCPQTGLWPSLTSSMTCPVTRCRSVRRAKPPSTRSIFTNCHCCGKSFCACEAGRTTSSLRAYRRSMMHTALHGSAAAKALHQIFEVATANRSSRHRRASITATTQGTVASGFSVRGRRKAAQRAGRQGYRTPGSPRQRTGPRAERSAAPTRRARRAERPRESRRQSDQIRVAEELRSVRRTTRSPCS